VQIGSGPENEFAGILFRRGRGQGTTVFLIDFDPFVDDGAEFFEDFRLIVSMAAGADPAGDRPDIAF